MPLENTNKLTWEDFEYLANDICKQISAKPIIFDSIIGIARGGLFLSTLLSYKLNIKKLYIINTQLYCEKQLISPKILYYPENLKLDNVLVVDDILDTGSTYHLIKDLVSEISENAYWAALIDKKKSNVQFDFVGQTLNNDIWVEFPWNK